MTQEKYDNAPLGLQVRETRVGDWILITSLKNALAVSPQNLSELYS